MTPCSIGRLSSLLFSAYTCIFYFSDWWYVHAWFFISCILHCNCFIQPSHLNHICLSWLSHGFQVATEGNLGLAEAYINGCFSFLDKREGLLNFLLVKLCHSDFIGRVISSFQIKSMIHFFCRFSLLTEMRVGAAALPDKGSETFNCPLCSYHRFFLLI